MRPAASRSVCTQPGTLAGTTASATGAGISTAVDVSATRRVQPWCRCVFTVLLGRGWALAGQDLTAPAVSPWTRARCSSRKPSSTGTLTTREAAITWFQYTLDWVA